LSTPELARLLGLTLGSVRNWDTGHRSRPGFELEPRKDGGSFWWHATDSTACQHSLTAVTAVNRTPMEAPAWRLRPPALMHPYQRPVIGAKACAALGRSRMMRRPVAKPHVTEQPIGRLGNHGPAGEHSRRHDVLRGLGSGALGFDLLRCLRGDQIGGVAGLRSGLGRELPLLRSERIPVPQFGGLAIESPGQLCWLIRGNHSPSPGCKEISQ
jgi:hypothetical protein